MFAGLAATSLFGCPDRTISKVDPAQGRVEYKDIPVTVNRDIDMLFLIDDSPSMADKQKNLADNFPDFIHVLQTIPGGLPNVHIGVATSDVGSSSQANQGPPVGSSGQRGSCMGTGKNGNLQQGMATAELGLNHYISDVLPAGSMTRVTNYGDPSTLATVFGKMAQVGANGCGFEQHIEGAKRALSPTDPDFGTFVRPSAYLAIIFIADEDDCSLKDAQAFFGSDTNALGALASFRCTRFGVICDVGGGDTNAMNQVGLKDQCHPNDGSQYLAKVADYADFFKKLKPGAEQNVIVAGIIGDTSPFQVELDFPSGTTTGTKIPMLTHSCTYQGGDGPEVADPAIRIKYLLDQFPGRSTFTTVCQKNLSDGLQLIAQLLKTVIGDPCIEGNLADVDPTTDGPQYDCAVSFVTNEGNQGGTQSEMVLPECDTNATNKPCWHLVPDTTNCTTGLHLTLKVEGQDSAPANTHIVANCVTTTCNNDGTCDSELGEDTATCPADCQ